MTFSQTAVLLILAIAFGLFAWGKLRYDVVAFLTLMSAVVVGVVPAANAFNGFGHPATVTVAAVLVLTRALHNVGIPDLMARRLATMVGRPSWHVGILSAAAAFLSSFMNNVGALALLMPVAVQSSEKAGRSPAIVLMPLAFASILGGLVTLIGTPPNIIIAAFRGDATGTPFGMFDFAPVGLVVAIAGTVFLAVAARRLLPERVPANGTGGLLNIEAYVTEVRVLKTSIAWGKTLREVQDMATERDLVVVSLIRRHRKLAAPAPEETLKTYDVLLVEGGPHRIDAFVSALGLRIVGAKSEEKAGLLRATGTETVEAVVTPRSRMDGRTAESMRLTRRYGVSLLAVARQGRPYRGRLKSFRFHAGDLVLLHGESERVTEAMTTLGCLPLAPRGLTFGKRRAALGTAAVFAGAILVAGVGLLPFTIALGIAVLAVVIARIVPPRDVYDSIDWSVIVLLGAMIPLGQALETTGTTDLIAATFFDASPGASAWGEMTVLMVVTLLLSAVLNNAATAVIMAPLAIGIAQRLGVNADPFLMAVSVGASSAFLTPIGHQNNTLVMGPGGYQFGDYLRLGLPLTIVVLLVATPLIPMVWPF